jgi:hypothetical protein
MLYGYNVGDFFCVLNRPSSSLSITILNNKIKPRLVGGAAVKGRVEGVFSKIRVECSQLGIPVLLPYVPDTRAVESEIAAAIHRFGRHMEEAGPATGDFYLFAVGVISKMTVVKPEDVPSFDEWLDHSDYDPGRKQMLRELRQKTIHLEQILPNSKSFIKWEGYQKVKMPRAINSPSDASKSVLGPLCHALDKNLFAMPYFVKGKDPRTWPKLLLEAFGQSPVVETDFSSFEAHHHHLFAELVWYWMHHTLRAVMSPLQKKLMRRMVLGTNHTKFTNIKVSCDQRLMSGSMWTSSANGLLNFLLMSYLCCRTKHPQMPPKQLSDTVQRDFVGFIEGDDGICLDVGVDQRLIDSLGIVLEFDPAQHFTDASFCGIVCDPTTLEVVTDPLKILRNFFLLPPRFQACRESRLWALLRAKSLSYKYLYCNCPIVGALCDHVLKLTRHVNVSSQDFVDAGVPYHSSGIDRKKLLSSWRDVSRPTPEMRTIVSKRFDVPVDAQVVMEEIIRVSNNVISLPLLNFMSLDDIEHLQHLKGQVYPLYVPDLVLSVLREGLTRSVHETSGIDVSYNKGSGTLDL